MATQMRWLVLLALAAAAGSASAQIYRWTDASGRVHFSNTAPPPGTKAVVVDPDARQVPPGPESTECYTIRCQGERMEERTRKRESEAARMEAERQAQERTAAVPKQPRGLEFRKYISIQRGMTEGELLGIAGEPDLKTDQGGAFTAPTTVQVDRNLSIAAVEGRRTTVYTYLPTSSDPFTTTITLIGGRVSDLDRARKF
jgi:Domain of unknown function (DUF4124)